MGEQVATAFFLEMAPEQVMTFQTTKTLPLGFQHFIPILQDLAM
jgi:hypothetical protein